MFFHQLAAMLSAGLSIERALSSLQESARVPLRDVVTEMKARIEGGSTLAEAFNAHPDLFTRAELAIIDAGERSGRLDELLVKLGDTRDLFIKMRQKMITRLIYPVILLIVLVLVGTLLEWIGGGVTDALRFFFGSGIAITGLGVLVHFLFIARHEGSPWQQAIDIVVLRVPMASGVIRSLASARFLRTFEALYLAGISHPLACPIAAAATGSVPIGEKLLKAQPLLSDGVLLSQALASTQVFDVTTISLLSTGEASGSLDTMLDKAASAYEDKATNAITALSVVLPIVVYLLVAIMVAIRVVTFYMDLFGSYSELGSF